MITDGNGLNPKSVMTDTKRMENAVNVLFRRRIGRIISTGSWEAEKPNAGFTA